MCVRACMCAHMLVCVHIHACVCTHLCVLCVPTWVSLVRMSVRLCGNYTTSITSVWFACLLDVRPSNSVGWGWDEVTRTLITSRNAGATLV